MRRIVKCLHWVRERLDDTQRGSAIIEFLGIAVLLFIPLIYLMITVFDVQRHNYAITHAAREAGRAFLTSESEEIGVLRAQSAVRISLEDQGLSREAQKSVTIRFVPQGASCQRGETLPHPGAGTLRAGAEFLVCIVLEYQVPGVPSFLDPAANTVTGKFIARVEDFRQ